MANEPFRFFWRFASDAGSFSASSTAPGFDVDNLQRNTLDTKWKSDAFGSDLTETVTVDLGSAIVITAFALLDHDLEEADTIVLRYANDANFTVDVGTISPTWYEDTLIEFFASVTRRYWRLEVTITDSSGTRQAGRLLLGPSYEMERNIAVGYQVGPGQDTGRTITTQGGQAYGDIGERLKVLSGEFIAHKNVDDEEVNALKNSYGKSVPFFVAMDWENEPIKKSLYGRMTGIGPSLNIAMNKWSFPLMMVEQK